VSKLTVSLLGAPQIARDGVPLELRRHKVLALLAYLSVTGQPHSRDVLVNLLYPEQEPTLARSDFRQTLSILAGSLGAGWLEVKRATLRLPPRRGLWVDVCEFRRFRNGFRAQRPPESDAAAPLRQAAGLYRGDFLSGFSLKGCPGFDDWMLFEAEGLRREYALTLERLVEIHETRGELVVAIDWARRWLALDSLNECVHRHLMRLHNLAGQRASAIRQYELCRKLLRDELDATPDEETERLREEIQSLRPLPLIRPDRRVHQAAPGRVSPFRQGSPHETPATTGVILLLADVDPSKRDVPTEPALLESVRARCLQWLEQASEAGGGKVFRAPGSHFQAVFSSAAAAVEAALNAHVLLRSSGTQEPSSESSALCVAVHAGPADGSERNFDSPVYDRAAALLSAAHGGQVLLSAEATNRIRGSLPQGASVQCLGTHRLKDLGPRQTVYQLLHPDQSSRSVTLRTLDSHPNNLPSQSTTFVGRSRELPQLESILRSRESRLLTLTGPGGTGKTRLALQAAAMALECFEHGVFFVDLARWREPAQVVPAIAEVLDIQGATRSNRSLFEILKDHLERRRVLLILDNFEHLLHEAPRITQLLAACPGLDVMATSREPLHLSAERVVAVPSLDLPQGEVLPARQSQSGALRLFVERGKAARPDFELTPENVAACAEICIRLAGIPLAIELAASRLKALSAPELLVKLRDWLRVLRTDSRDAPSRQQAMQDEMDWSYDLLKPEEQRLFRRLSVFVGGCSLEAAETVCPDPPDNEHSDILAGLISLIDKSLVMRREMNGETRFWMHEIVREYAASRLHQGSERDALRLRHAHFYRRLAGHATLELHGSAQDEWLDRLEWEHGNLQAAMAWTFERGTAEESMGLASSLEYFFYRKGHFDEGKNWLARAIARSEPCSDGARGKALLTLGIILFNQGDWLQARSLLRESRQLCHGAGLLVEEARAIAMEGVAVRSLGDPSKATELAREAVRVARSSRDPWQLGHALLAAHATTGGTFVGEPPMAELQEAMRLFTDIGDTWGIAHVLDGLGDLYRTLGAFTEAQAHYAQALSRFMEMKDEWMCAWTQEGMGRAYHLAGDLTNAEERYREGLAVFDSLGDRANALYVLSKLGLLARIQGDAARAARLLGAFTNLQAALMGNASAPRIESTPELAAALAECPSACPAEWARGLASTYKEAIEDALGPDKDRDRQA
jgi:predicted ATPase/DNA-binding SARP family transcriptional activator